eukprot:CAMPEP_0176294914 /NCGR_PEP_ID=MMETSP0121_2-20121125/57391_1 /TAXON_ID=160619 /ORGANISM="Kryptoperidinium foliaceum, Strain CCMP 1326" /LENGTH=81 /DNA_ID=CAMNT_0017635965 /DNA_START=152 /DNA_END=396 /DNA_ORIENTATION=+
MNMSDPPPMGLRVSLADAVHPACEKGVVNATSAATLEVADVAALVAASAGNAEREKPKGGMAYETIRPWALAFAHAPASRR